MKTQSMIKSVAEAVAGWTFSLIIRIPLFILGLIVVPIGLCFPKVNEDSSRPFTQHHTDRNWKHVGLPKAFWLWSNDRDGAMGDKRGWWFNRHGDTFYSRFRWMALRNPVNNMRFWDLTAINMYTTEVELLAGQSHVGEDDDGSGMGWHFVGAKGTKRKFYGFRYVSQEYPKWLVKIIPWLAERVFTIRIGAKLKVKYNEEFLTNEAEEASEDNYERAWKGFTFRINPFLKYKD